MNNYNLKMKNCFITLICILNVLFQETISKIVGDPMDNIVMAHRGLWGYYPEHSIRGFELAYFMGADYLETDLQLTKDGELIIFHDCYLDDTTDVNQHEEFQSRRRTDSVDGLLYKDKLFVCDFTFEELQTLFIKQRVYGRPTNYDHEFKIILLEDLIKMTLKLNELNNKRVGIYIEPKSSTYYYEKVGKNIDESLANLLKQYNLLDKTTEEAKNLPIVIQSFDFATLTYFRANSNLFQIALMRWREPYNITLLSQYADGLGADVDFLLYERIDDLLYCNGTEYESFTDFNNSVVRNPDRDSVEQLNFKIMTMQSNKFIEYANSFKLKVNIWNMNNNSPKFNYDPSLEYAKMRQLGVNGMFADFCDTALFALKHYKNLLTDSA